ncbi:MAG: hypothetical protein M1830_005179 [Pleopsidium flavum]|nr:MAG: hypothetical protein M1830_005179 [Pleopsidium flavum]
MAAPSRPSLRSSTRRSVGLAESPPTATHQNTPNIRRAKRARRPSSLDDEGQATKKQRIRLDVTARPKITASSRNVQNLAPPANKPSQDVATVASQITNGVLRIPTDSITNASVQHVLVKSTTITSKSNATVCVQQIDKRTLRSQDGGSRFKSELSLYFPNYDQIISDEPKEPDFLTAETSIFVVDEPSKSAKSQSTIFSPTNSWYNWSKGPTIARNLSPPAIGSSFGPHNISDKLNNAQKIDFSSIERNARHSSQDPLTDVVYHKAHRRAERQEKQLRNIEKERAQHEKVQLERLLDGLKGHDWLRVMGITGITDTEKKGYEPKRDFFIQEVACLIEKFKTWKEEEKRRKLERDQALLAEEDIDESTVGRMVSMDGLSDGDPPDYSDVDAWAARQLHQEAVSATGQRQHKKRQREPAQSISIQPLPPEQKPFVSFYSKAYLREAAIGKHRRGRSRTAFGYPIPDMLEEVFQLPSDLLTEDVLAASARSRRRSRRESKEKKDVPD